jgi:hypothetical protein
MLPKNINDWIVSNPRPINRYGKEYKKIINNLFSSCSKQHLKDYMITSLESEKVLIEMGINPNTAFYEYYVAFISTDSSENEEVDLLYDLDEIYEDYKQVIWHLGISYKTKVSLNLPHCNTTLKKHKKR